MRELQNPSSAPIDFVFEGFSPDATTMGLCVEAARSLRLQSGSVRSCTVVVTRRERETVMRVGVCADGWGLAFDYPVPASSGAQFRAWLRVAFADVARKLDRQHEALAASSGSRLACNARSKAKPPPSIWYG